MVFPHQVRPPLQERTYAGWERILDSGVAILEETGYEGFTIAAICARAEVNPPTIYARVRTKRDLFLAVFEHGFRAIQAETEAIRAGLSGGSADAVVRGAVAAMASNSLAHERFHRPVLLRAEADVEVARRTHQARADTATWFRELVLQHSAALRDPDPVRVDAGFRIVFVALMARITTPYALDVAAPISDEAFIADLQETAVRFLLRDS